MSAADYPATPVALGKAGDISNSATRSVASEQDLCAFLTDAEKNSTAVVVGDGRVPPNAPDCNVTRLNLTALNRVIEHEKADQVILVETGMTVGTLNKFLAGHQQWWPVALPEHWTIGQAIGAGDGGAIEHQFGGPRSLVLGMKVALSDGTSIRTGGKVIKNVSGYDLNKLFIGSHGHLGIPCQAYLRLYALPSVAKTVVHFYSEAADVLEQSRKLIASGLPCTTVEILGADAARECGLPLPDGCQFALAVRVQGAAAVVAELTTAVTLLLGKTAACLLHDKEELEFWTKQEQLFDTTYGDKWLQISLPLSLMKICFYTLSTDSCFRAIPLIGKIIVNVRNETVASLVKRLGTGRTSEEAAVVAYPDERWNYRVDYLPDAGNSLRDVKRRLKERFDRKNILNPFVSL